MVGATLSDGISSFYRSRPFNVMEYRFVSWLFEPEVDVNSYATACRWRHQDVSVSGSSWTWCPSRSNLTSQSKSSSGLPSSLATKYVTRPVTNLYMIRWKILRESTTPRESEIWRFCCQHLATLAAPSIRSIKFKQSPVYGVFWRLSHPSTDRNETRTWSSLSPRNLPIKFGTNPSTIFLVIVVTDRQTDTQTNAGKNILPRFRGEKNIAHRFICGVGLVLAM